jgi:ubiquinone/menaquinone biosynthesis C-methylase UbiE
VIHDAASEGFSRAPEAYDRARPDYPSTAIDWLWDALALESDDAVADIGAGTGKLSVPLAERGAVVTAVEPVDAMRERLERRLPQAVTLAAPAEDLPLADGVMVAVVAGQAFHWFANNAALGEFHRVLRQGGQLGLIWNRRDLTDPVQAAISELIEPYSQGVPRHAADEWREVLERSPRFERAGEATFAFTQELDRDGLADRVGSTSFIAAMSADQRQPLLERVRELADVGGHARLAYTCEAFAYRAT